MKEEPMEQEEAEDVPKESVSDEVQSSSEDSKAVKKEEKEEEEKMDLDQETNPVGNDEVEQPEAKEQLNNGQNDEDKNDDDETNAAEVKKEEEEDVPMMLLEDETSNPAGGIPLAKTDIKINLKTQVEAFDRQESAISKSSEANEDDDDDSKVESEFDEDAIIQDPSEKIAEICREQKSKLFDSTRKLTEMPPVRKEGDESSLCCIM